MSENGFLTKTCGVLLALTVMFSAGLWLLRTGETPARSAPGYTVITDKDARSASAVMPQAPLRINVNTASAEELQALTGIGPVKAEAMVEYREKHGYFTCAEDLLNVSGIGEATLAGIRDDITWEVTP